MTVDTILFFNEFDLLEIRLHELAPVVDRFLIIEANRTFSGKRKPLHFLHNRKKFSAFSDKITSWEVTDMPKGNDPWAREKHQRNAIAEALKFMNAKDEDRVLVSDVDEIPRASAVKEATKTQQKVLFELRLFYYYVNVRCQKWPWWRNLRMASVCDLKNNPQQIRDKHWSTAGFKVIPDAGWHFSFIGGIDRIQQKIAAFSHHREYNKPQFTNAKHLEKCLAQDKDLFNRKISWRHVSLDKSYPHHLLENLDRFSYMVSP